MPKVRVKDMSDSQLKSTKQTAIETSVAGWVTIDGNYVVDIIDELVLLRGLNRRQRSLIDDLENAIYEIGHEFILVGSVSEKTTNTVRSVLLSREQPEVE